MNQNTESHAITPEMCLRSPSLCSTSLRTVARTREFKGSRPVHGIKAHPVVEGNHSSVLIPPVLRAPADGLCGNSQRLEFA